MKFLLCAVVVINILRGINSGPTVLPNQCQEQVRNFFNTAQDFRDDLQSCTPDLTVIGSDVYTYVDQFTQNFDEFRSDYNQLLNCNGFLCQDRLTAQMTRYVDIMSYDLEMISNEIAQAEPALDPGTAYCLNSVVNNVNNSLIFNLNC